MNPDPTRFRHVEFTLDELAGTAARLLRALAVEVDDGRVGGAPDARTIRFYQTTGVLDRPLRYDGRRAIYGYRHLLQILAVKRLQAEGYPLGMIQSALPAKSTGEIERALAGSSSPKAPAPGPAVEASPGPPWPTAGPEHTVAPRPVLTADIAAGVTVTVDPAQVSDPEQLIRRLAASLAVERSPKED